MHTTFSKVLRRTLERFSRCVLLVLALSLAPSAFGQSNASLDSYTRARAILDQGVKTVGGAEALATLRAVRRDLEGEWVNPGQARNPENMAPSRMPHTVYHDHFVSFVDYGERRWFEEIDFTNTTSGDLAVQFDAVSADDGFNSLTFLGGPPLLRVHHDGSQRARMISEKLRRFPEGLLRMALERLETLQWVGAAEEDAHSFDVISFADPHGIRVVLYFDSRSHLLMKSETVDAHAVLGDVTTEVAYSDYRPVGKLQLPFRMIDRIGGETVELFQVSTISIDEPMPVAALRRPVQFTAVEEDPDEPRVESLGRGLYLIRGSYNVVFAEFKDWIAVFEAPLNSEYAERCLQLVRATVPEKPVRYLVSTHFHYDHIGGVRPYIARGIRILTTQDAGSVIARAASTQRTLLPDAQSNAARAPIIEAVSTRRVLDDAANRVEIYDFGPTPHAEHMLVAHFPHQGVLFVADLLDINPREFALGGADAVVLAQRIAERRLHVDRIVPVHGVPGTRRVLDSALATRSQGLP